VGCERRGGAAMQGHMEDGEKLSQRYKFINRKDFIIFQGLNKGV